MISVIYDRWGARTRRGSFYCSSCGETINPAEAKCPACDSSPDKDLVFPVTKEKEEEPEDKDVA